jgi:hypothetical protein
MSDYKLETGSMFLRQVEKVFLIIITGGMMIAFSTVCYGFQWEGMEIMPSITLVTEYNDNIYYSYANEVDDVINRVEPGFALHVPGTRSELNLAYTAGFEFFAMHPGLNDVTHAATGMVRLQPTEHLIFTCNDIFSRAKDLAEIDLLGLRRQREWFWANTVTPSLAYTFGPDRILKLSYENNTIDFDNPILADSYENKVNGLLTYRITRRGIVTLDYTYLNGEYPHTDIGTLDGHAMILGYEYHLNPLTSILANSSVLFRHFTGPTFTDYNVYDFLLGFKRNLSANLTIEVQGGYLRFAPYGMKAIDSGVGIFNVTYTLLSNTTFTFRADKGYEELFAAIETLGYTQSWGVNATLSHTLYRFWSIELNGAYRHRDYIDVPRVDRFWTAGGSLVFEPVKWFRGELSYEHTSLDSSYVLSSNKVNRVMLTLQLKY